MLTERQGERLPDWLDAVRQDNLPSLHTLAAAIDRDAVTAGLTLPRNSGVIEGHVNRIKMLKRQMFGAQDSNFSGRERCCHDSARLTLG
ncbi:transposase [Streptomyces sp. SID10853]|uniref:transposase n=1 Tax=Streptomyces sp. SID10853 TaxID=2706028 RepID=UPI0013C22456|nr:transposase [Streptomyces sp. SID10853]NDZ79049.1 transposase [Streptomyces sp. SID10853]